MKPNMAQVRDLLMPGLRERERHNRCDGEVYVDPKNSDLMYHRLGRTHKAIITREEVAHAMARASNKDWLKLATARMNEQIGMPPPRKEVK